MPAQDEKGAFNVFEQASIMCGNSADIKETDSTLLKKTTITDLLAQADALCISSPPKQPELSPDPSKEKINPSSALFARALVSEVTDNPNTMTPAVMAEREKKLLQAQTAARNNKDSSRKAVGAPGGVGQPSVLLSIAHVLGTDTHDSAAEPHEQSKSIPPNSLQENRAQVASAQSIKEPGKFRVTIGLSLSRRHSTVGHADTVTRQTAFDFNELQDREYKYVSSTDSSGWRAGGGERGGAPTHPPPSPIASSPISFDHDGSGPPTPQTHKVAAPDIVHIPIIHIDAESPMAIDAIISALARGEVFIPHMAVLPEALSVDGISPPDLVVRFGCERNEDTPPDEWPNWSLEFMHNQLYEYFQPLGAVWTKRPFQITLAKKVRWKTVKHMNRYFAHAERVLDAWREKGPQYLNPQLSYIEGGATPEEVARPHGIYLMRNGVPTNYFAPNFEPPYTTKMTRSLLLNVLDKSWDKKRREWTGEPVPRLVTPASLVSTMFGCTDPTQQGFMANQVTSSAPPQMTAVMDVKTTNSLRVNVPEGGNTIGLMTVRPNASQTSSYHMDPIDLENRLRFGEHFQEGKGVDFVSPTSTAGGETPTKRTSSYGRSPTPERGETRVRGNLPARKVVDISVDTTRSEFSGYQDSVTTVPHMNSTSLRLVEREMERQKERLEKKQIEERENKTLEESRLGAHLEGPHSEEGGTTFSYSPVQKNYGILEKDCRNPRKAEQARAAASYESSGRDKYGMGPGVIADADSFISLNYSMDSSLMGGELSTGSGATKKNGVQSKHSDAMDGVPSDAELYEVGWAKALDASSGSYYYFTLDRTKTMWENPLEPASTGNESLPEGSMVI
jgi:hypothetical protein